MKALFIYIMCIFSSCTFAQKTEVATFEVTQTQRQTIDGFGASDAWSMWQIGCWDDSLQTKVADWLFSQDKGIGLSIWRFNAGVGSASQGDSAQINRDTRTEYYDRQAGQRRFLQLAKERGVPTFIAFFNSPPVHLTQNGLATNTGRGGTLNLRPDAYGDFASYMADMMLKAKKEDGIQFDYISPVNEPDGHWNWQGPKQEGSPATNREIARVTRLLSAELLKRHLDTKIVINESSDIRCMLGVYEADWQRGNEIQCFWNPDSMDTYVGNLTNVAHVHAGHSYWTNTPVLSPSHPDYATTGLYGYRKRLADALSDVGTGFWMSELCIMGNDEEIHGGGGFDFSMEVALYVARVMHYDLTVANARSWQWWRAAGGDYKDGLLRMYVKGERLGRDKGRAENNMVRDSKLLWTIGNFSRFIRPGAVRLEVKGDMESDGLMLSAYRNANGRRVLVAINYSNQDRVMRVNSFGKQAAAYRTSDTLGENLKPVGTINMEKATLPPRSVTTFVL